MTAGNRDIISELGSEFGEHIIIYNQQTIDGTPTIWITANNLIQLLKYLKSEVTLPIQNAL